MSRMKSLTTFLALAMVMTWAVLANAQGTATTPASTPATTAKPATKAMPASATKMTTTATTASTKPMTTTKKEAAAQASNMAKYDLNTASKDDLMKIPGIGDATVDKIIAGRPWKMKSDLVKKGVMNKAQYAKSSKYMIAKAAAK